MKKTIILIISVVIIILSIFYSKYLDYNLEQKQIKQNNLEYETYLDKQIYGTELTSIINRAIHNNEVNAVEKDEQGIYIKNDTNSVSIDVKMIDDNKTYKMEMFYNGGMNTFIDYYDFIYFKCTKIDYNSAGKVSYMLFEQVSS